MVDVFISYSRSDEAKAAMIAHAVEAAGYEVWWDAELPPHQSYGEVITDKIEHAKAAIVLWSATAAKSEWVRAEADMARHHRKLIQTTIDDVIPPLPFNQIQYAEIGDWHGEPDHPGWRKVLVSLADLCRRPATEGPPPRAVPSPPPPRAQAPPPPTPVSGGARWPLFAGIGIGVIGAIALGTVLLGQRGGAGAERSAPVASDTAMPPADATSRFDLTATVDDPDGYSNVRETASATGRIVGRIPTGQTFSTFRQAGDWWQVRLGDGVTGYVARSRIRLSDEAGSAGQSGKDEKPAAAPTYASSDMTFPDSSTRLLEPSEVYPLGPSTLRYARNEIYARKGRRFADPDLRDYFGRFAWYRALYDEVALNPVERQNIALIQQAEQRYR